MLGGRNSVIYKSNLKHWTLIFSLGLVLLVWIALAFLIGYLDIGISKFKKYWLKIFGGFWLLVLIIVILTTLIVKTEGYSNRQLIKQNSELKDIFRINTHEINRLQNNYKKLLSLYTKLAQGAPETEVGISLDTN